MIASAPRRCASAVERGGAGGVSLIHRQHACGHGDGKRSAGAHEQHPQPAIAPSRDLDLVKLRVAAGAQEFALKVVQLAVVPL